MKKYEYKLVTADEYEDFVEILNQHGKKGWDLVSYRMRDIADSEGDKISIQGIMKKGLD